VLVERFFHFPDGVSQEAKRGLGIIQPHAPHLHAANVLQATPVLVPSGSLHGLQVSADPSNTLQTVPIYVLDFLNLAQRRRCAAAILARLFADIFRRFRLGCPLLYAPANAVSAALSPDNCFSSRSLSFFNCPMIEDTFPMRVPPRCEIVAEDRVEPFKRTSMRDKATNLMFQSV
jgi:hypothetical protein